MTKIICDVECKYNINNICSLDEIEIRADIIDMYYNVQYCYSQEK